jgi:acyl dehydratase
MQSCRPSLHPYTVTLLSRFRCAMRSLLPETGTSDETLAAEQRCGDNNVVVVVDGDGDGDSATAVKSPPADSARSCRSAASPSLTVSEAAPAGDNAVFAVVRATASYGLRDALLYAVSCGHGANGGDYRQDLRHVYEGPPRFEVAPSFCLALLFGAELEVEGDGDDDREARPSTTGTTASTRTSSFQRMLPFPPPVLGRLLGRLLEEENGQQQGECFPRAPPPAAAILASIPILHTHQSVRWIRSGGSGGLLRTPPRFSDGVETAQVWSWIESVRPRAGGGGTCEGKTDRSGVSPSWSPSTSRSESDAATAVTTRTLIKQHGEAVCEMESTFLLVGVRLTERPHRQARQDPPGRSNGAAIAPPPPPPPPQPQTPEPEPPASRPYSWEQTIELGNNAALLYRLASGDTNRLHVVGSATGDVPWNRQQERRDSRPRRRPVVIHGLCTLGHVARVLARHYDPQAPERTDGASLDDCPGCAELASLGCRFASPVFAGDELVLQAWEQWREVGRGADPTTASRWASESAPSFASSPCFSSSDGSYVDVHFLVRNRSTGAVVLDRGRAVLRVPAAAAAARQTGTTAASKYPPRGLRNPLLSRL